MGIVLAGKKKKKAKKAKSAKAKKKPMLHGKRVKAAPAHETRYPMLKSVIQTNLDLDSYPTLETIISELEDDGGEAEATTKDGKPHCDMEKDCDKPVTHIDNKGFIYCEHHGAQRKSSVPCRKLTGKELEQLKAGQPIGKY